MSERRQLPVIAIIAVVSVVLLGALLLWSTRRPSPAEPEAAAAPAASPGTFRPTAEQLRGMNIVRVEPGTRGTITMATGTIAADGNLSTPLFLPYSGQVTQVLVDTGRVVTKGQPLLVVRTGDFVDARNALLSAQASYQAATAQRDSARRTAERQRQLTETAGGAQKDYQQAQTDLAAAEAQERTADAVLTAAREKLTVLGADDSLATATSGHEDATVRAPIGGTIATRDVAPGQYVSAGGDKPLLTITDTSRVWLMAQLAESEAGAVRTGDSVEVTTPAWPDRVFHAVVDTVGVGLDPATHRLLVRATIANPDGALKPQMFASFSIHHTAPATTDKIYIPTVAVIHEEDSARVWVLGADGVLSARAVKTGAQQNGQVEITDGLHTGEQIVTSGALFVNEAGLGE
ncbi:MAG: efflux RND transporter periplasmic adaptor subunit [Acidobacteriaceae bacterium]|nr:efflux RND transporter periplasmic adaptor subunit [Acidobacteriaceae bacterium]